MMKEKVLVVGGGGREHAIAAALSRSGATVHAAMRNRNPGMVRICQDHYLTEETDVEKVVAYAKRTKVGLAFVGPEAPLEVGLADALEKEGIGCVGPSRAAARVETSKSFARDVMQRHGVPGNIRFQSFDDVAEAKGYLESIDFEVAVKPVGLTGGKGVKIEGEHLQGKREVADYIDEIFERRIGGAGVVLEERLAGEEFTLQAFCDGKRVVAMPLVQDHKRAYEGDRGPNTGGMGSYSAGDHLLPFVTSDERERATHIVRRMVQALADEGCPYRGVIYGQFMLTREGPKVIEFNARFGDPEAMNVLTILRSDLVKICHAVCDGTLSEGLVDFQAKATVCKYVVPQGYGTGSLSGLPISVDDDAIARLGAACYYANVDEVDGRMLTGTSRAVGVVGVADSIEEAERTCEAALTHVEGDAVFVRHDIGKRELVQRRVDHMRQVREGAR